MAKMRSEIFWPYLEAIQKLVMQLPKSTLRGLALTLRNISRKFLASTTRKLAAKPCQDTVDDPTECGIRGASSHQYRPFSLSILKRHDINGPSNDPSTECIDTQLDKTRRNDPSAATLNCRSMSLHDPRPTGSQSLARIGLPALAHVIRPAESRGNDPPQPPTLTNELCPVSRKTGQVHRS